MTEPKSVVLPITPRGNMEEVSVANVTRSKQFSRQFVNLRDLGAFCLDQSAIENRKVFLCEELPNLPGPNYLC